MKLAQICVMQVCVINCAILYAVLMASRSWHHCQQLGDLPRVAGGVGSDATAEAVDGQAKAMQLYDIKVMSGP